MFTWEKSNFRDKFGQIVETAEFEFLIDDPEYKIVNQEMVGNYLISTVWLGIAQGTFGNEYFETAIFDQNNEMEQIDEVYRYHNINEAEEGHNLIVMKYKNVYED